MKKNKVLVAGCFNRIHPGHIYLFKEAKKLGKKLIVIITNDANNNKNIKTPAIDRMKMLKEIKMIDKVIVGEKNDFTKIFLKEKPNVLALGYDQSIPKSFLGLWNSNVYHKVDIIRIKKYKDYHTCTQS